LTDLLGKEMILCKRNELVALEIELMWKKKQKA